MTRSQDVARAMVASRERGEDWPLPSQVIEGLDAATAYEIQRELVARRLESDAIAGFKAGATAAPAQQLFGLTEPFCGVLFASGRRAMGAPIAAADFRNLVLETELCFRIGRAIPERPRDVGALRDHVDACFPAIELADPGGYGPVKFTGPDLIAGNGASAAYLPGAASEWRSVDLDDVGVHFSLDGQVLHEAVSGDLMGGQWRALSWLVEAVLDRGYELREGQLLLTGSLGSGHPGRPGHYVADYGALGEIAFDVV